MPLYAPPYLDCLPDFDRPYLDVRFMSLVCWEIPNASHSLLLISLISEVEEKVCAESKHLVDIMY